MTRNNLVSATRYIGFKMVRRSHCRMCCRINLYDGMPNGATNAALKAAIGGFTAYIYWSGCYTAGDGGKVLYVWNANSNCTDDGGGSCIAPNSGAGRLILKNNEAASVKAFGAHCDGSCQLQGGTRCCDRRLCSSQRLRHCNEFVEQLIGNEQ
jgi:hypothetical protein